MSYQLIIPPEIEHEIMRDINALFERIAERPLQFPMVYAAKRRALLRHHDFSVFFELDAARGRAVIHGVIHQHRDPALWPR